MFFFKGSLPGEVHTNESDGALTGSRKPGSLRYFRSQIISTSTPP